MATATRTASVFSNSPARTQEVLGECSAFIALSAFAFARVGFFMAAEPCGRSACCIVWVRSLLRREQPLPIHDRAGGGTADPCLADKTAAPPSGGEGPEPQSGRHDG